MSPSATQCVAPTAVHFEHPPLSCTVTTDRHKPHQKRSLLCAEKVVHVLTGATAPQRFLLIADWGLSQNSSVTLQHILQSAANTTTAPAVLYIADFCYAGEPTHCSSGFTVSTVYSSAMHQELIRLSAGCFCNANALLHCVQKAASSITTCLDCNLPRRPLALQRSFSQQCLIAQIFAFLAFSGTTALSLC